MKPGTFTNKKLATFDGRRFYVVDITCPYCADTIPVIFAGWSALRCLNCAEYFKRPEVKK